MKTKSTSNLSVVNEIPGASIVGKGVDVFGKFTGNTNFEVAGVGPATHDVEINGITYKVPTNMDVNPALEFETEVETFSSVEAVKDSFSAEASLKYGKDKGIIGGFSAEFKTRYDHLSEKLDESYYVLAKSSSKLWSISIRNPELGNLPEYQDLPNSFNSGNKERFFEFLKKYGSHYVHEAVVGARLYYYEAIDKQYARDEQDASAQAKFEYKTLFTDTKAEASTSWSKVSTSWKTNRQSYVRVIGGDGAGLAGINDPEGPAPQINVHDAFNAWQKSVKKDPVVISYRLKPIYELATGDKADALREATDMYTRYFMTVTSDERTPVVVFNGNALQPDNGFPYNYNQFNNNPYHTPALWTIVIDRMTMEPVFNYTFNFPEYREGMTPTYEVRLQREQERIYNLVRKYLGTNRYFLCLLTFDWDFKEAPFQNVNLDQQGLNSFLRASGGGQGLSDWENASISSSSPGLTRHNYALVGAIGGGEDQGMDAFARTPVKLEISFIPEVDESGNVLFLPTFN